ncbi:SDR family oxidoreductase [Blastococcus deserti]|uniref:SDR family oxidoreductase n=1 Tax=Blastococcus deserti TaxID=2259033 RepID=A0ABW4XA49_9ACTN
MSGSDPRCALVTGAGRGIGRSIAEGLAAAGYRVYAGVRSEAAATQLAAASARIVPVELDVTRADHVAALDAVLPARLDALVNNAGIAVPGPVEAVGSEAVRHQFEVNLFGPLDLTRAMLPRLRGARGRIVFISSVNGRVSFPGSGIYNASKFALEGLADCLRVELRPWGIKVLLVEPGVTDTDPWRHMMAVLDETAADLSPEHRQLYRAHLAGQRAMCQQLQQRTAPAAGVAEAVRRGLTRRRPGARRLVGTDAHALVVLKAMLPTRALDALWARGLGLDQPPTSTVLPRPRSGAARERMPTG